MKNLNPLADRGDIENITMRWNGGLTNYEDRLDYYDRAALVLLGYGVNELVQFQKDAKIDYKTGSGPITRGASLHKALVALTAKPEQAKTVQAAPVVEVKEVPVKLGNPDKPFWQSKEFVATALTGGGVTGTVSAVGTIPWQNLIILIVAAFLGLIAFLAWSRMQDAKKQEAKAEAIKS